MINKKILIRRVEIEFDNGSPDFYFRLKEARKAKDLTDSEKTFLNVLKQKFDERLQKQM